MDFITMNDKAVLNELGLRIQQRRLAINMTQVELAKKAGVSRVMIQRLEAGLGCALGGFVRITRVLGIIAQWEIFLPAPGVSPLQLAKLKGHERQRASMPRGSA